MHNDKLTRKKNPEIHGNRNIILLTLTHLFIFFLGFHSHVSNVIRVDVPTATKGGKVIDREYGNGWHSIEVFYGKPDNFHHKPPQQEWFGQLGQDIIVSRLFREKMNGYFIDLAANHAYSLSNTYSLERKFHWTGLCIEPNPTYWFDLAHRDCQVVAAVVGETRMEEVSFLETTGTEGGIVGEGFDNQQAAATEVKFTVPLYEILTRFRAPKVIDYLSLDVEGAESLVMQHFPFHEYSFNILTVERPREDLKALFVAYGYEYLGSISTWGETIWVRTSIKDTLNVASIEEFLVKSQ